MQPYQNKASGVKSKGTFKQIFEEAISKADAEDDKLAIQCAADLEPAMGFESLIAEWQACTDPEEERRLREQIEGVDMSNVVAFPKPAAAGPKPKPANGGDTAIQPDRGEAERFLALLDPDANAFTFQTFDDDMKRRKARKQQIAETNKKRKAKGLAPRKPKDPFAHILHGTLDKHWDELCCLNAQGAGIFITVNATDGKGRSTENIKRVRALFNDLDGAPLEPVTQSKPVPHMVVASSPGRYHPYWLVDDVELGKFEELQKGLIARFDGDEAVHDLPRVMRLPGFIHLKGEPFRSHVISTHKAPPYKAVDFNIAVKVSRLKEFVEQQRQREDKSPTQKLNNAALANLATWVPELFPDATPYHGDGFRVSSASLGRDLEEDISFTREGIKDFGVHDLDDPLDGKRTPVAIVMEHLFEVPVEDIAERTNAEAFMDACAWLRERLPDEEVSAGKVEQEPLQQNDENEKRIFETLILIHTVFGSDKWFEIGNALQSLHWKDGDGNDWALAVLDDWSKRNAKNYTNFHALQNFYESFDDSGDINRLFEIARGQKDPAKTIEPVDLWAQREAPPLPKGLLPKVIEEFSFRQAELMGCDPAGLAMGALTVCCAIMPDRIKVQVKKHDIRWKESARIWVAYEGPPSVQKSPMMNRVTEPLNRIDAELSKRFHEAKAAYDDMEKAEKEDAEKPRHERVRFEDVTPEAAQPILRDSPNGVLLVRDELSGWFGSIDKYSGSKGGGMDRGFWLHAFNGGVYSWDRVGRGSGNIPNLSVCVLGGIQEEPLRKLVGDGVDDGLIQRLFIIMLRSAVMGTDEPQAEDEYDDLIDRLYGLRDRPLHDDRHFSGEAQAIRRQLEQQHLDLAAGYERINKKLAAHIGKYKGLFARLCLLWHTIETLDEKKPWPSYINADIAQRVAKFLNEFLLQHAIAFYIGLLGLSDQHDRLLDVGGYILAHKLDTVTTRDIQRGSRSMRGMEKRETDRIFEQLEAYGWLERQTGRRLSDVVWIVNPEVHRLFAAKAEEERERRQRERDEIVASMPRGA